jgi:hypothetical protein
MPPRREIGRGTTVSGGGVFDVPCLITGSARSAREYLSTSFADGCFAAGFGSRHAPGIPTRLHPPPHAPHGEA